jgi:molecular chaperone GrpE
VGTERRPSGWRAWVVDRWLPARAQQALVIRLEMIEQRLDALDQTLRELRDGTGTAEALATLEKQIGRAGREQFKANTLAEAQATRLDAALDALRAADTRREADLAALREQSRSTQASARLDVVRSILPTLDGLDEALRSGRRLLTTTDHRPPTTDDQRALHDGPSAGPATDDGQRTTNNRPSFVEWLFGRSPVPQRAGDSVRQEGEPLREALDAWLVGLTFVRQRLLDTLAAEGVRPMDAKGQPFDPQRHIALEVVPSANGLPPGAVAAELRRGYMVGERVLRHAEVAVTRDERRPTTDDRPPTADHRPPTTDE